MVVAGSSWCWTVCFWTSMATISRVLMSATRTPAATHQDRSPVARSSSSCGSSTQMTGCQCASTPPPSLSRPPDLRGLEFAPLYESARELVLLERWAPGITVAASLPGGIELLVLDGSFIEGGEEFTRLSWLRLPAGATLQATAGRGGCEVWVKSGHRAHATPAGCSLTCLAFNTSSYK